MIKLSLNMDITLSVSPDYLQRMGLDFDSNRGLSYTIDKNTRKLYRAIDMPVIIATHRPTPLAQSAINQCFRNNSRVLDSLMITNIEVES